MATCTNWLIILRCCTCLGLLSQNGHVLINVCPSVSKLSIRHQNTISITSLSPLRVSFSFLSFFSETMSFRIPPDGSTHFRQPEFQNVWQSANSEGWWWTQLMRLHNHLLDEDLRFRVPFFRYTMTTTAIVMTTVTGGRITFDWRKVPQIYKRNNIKEQRKTWENVYNKLDSVEELILFSGCRV